MDQAERKDTAQQALAAPLVQHRAVHLPPAVVLFSRYVEDALGDKSAKPGS